MPGLRELKKHLRSVETVGQVAGAMRTVSAAKFSSLSRRTKEHAAYAETCRAALCTLSAVCPEQFAPRNPSAPECVVIIGGNRGLCGSFHNDLFAFARRELEGRTDYRLVLCGKMAAARLRDLPVEPDSVFDLPDVPEPEDGKALEQYLRDAYFAGEISGVTVICQRFYNVMRQAPQAVRLLPLAGGEETAPGELLILPDAGAVGSQVSEDCLQTLVYGLLLESACGVQAATMMAMRTAYDNANDSAENLRAAINRQRQGAVTSGVIETAAGMEEEE